MKKLLEKLKDTVEQVFIDYSSEQMQLENVLFEIDKIIENLKVEETQDEGIEKDVLFLNKKFTQKAMKEISLLCIGSTISIEDVANFVKHRIKIKKPLKTERPLKLFINELKCIIEAGYDKNKSIKIMEDHDWQSINLDWIAKKMPKTKSADLTKFGFYDMCKPKSLK